jgi:putative redox protein
MIDCQSEAPNAFPQVLHVRTHTFRADVGVASGSGDTAPGAHDYFDASLAACKALTAIVYARAHGIPLETVETHVESDNSAERTGRYVLKVRVGFHGPLSEVQRQRLYAAVGKCPVHKLMTTSEVVIETAPLGA